MASSFASRNKHPGAPHSHGAPRGFTLIEFMIAIAVTAILSALIYGVVLSQSRAYTLQSNLSKIQQNLRLSMDFMARNIAMAGYGTPGYTVTEETDEIPNGLLPAIRGYEAGSGASDSLQVVFSDPTRLAMTAWGTSQPCTTTQLQFSNTSDASYFVDAEYMMCFDYSDTNRMKSFMFRVNSVDSALGYVNITTPDNVEYYGAGGQCPTGDNLPRDLLCGPAQVLTFYIDADDTDGLGEGSEDHPVLMMSTHLAAFDPNLGAVPQGGDLALANNVEDLQIELCKAVGGVEPDCADPSEWTTWTAADNTSSGVLNVREVRLTVWARSEQVYPNKAAASATKPNPLTGAVDGYERQTDSTYILIRNLKMLTEY